MKTRRTFNYTGRARILREDIDVAIGPTVDGHLALQASLELDAYDFPPESAIVLEVSRRTNFARLDWGTVQEPGHSTEALLEDFATADGIRIRIKVIAPEDGGGSTGAGRILAEADNIRPKADHNQEIASGSLLDVIPKAMEEAWRLECSTEAVPVLFVNDVLGGAMRSFVRSDAFVALVLPEVLRKVMTHIVIEDGSDVWENADSWQEEWMSMSRALPGVPAPPTIEGDDVEEAELWIENLVRVFARRCRVREKVAQGWSEGDEG